MSVVIFIFGAPASATLAHVAASSPAPSTAIGLHLIIAVLPRSIDC
jgi:hypothetical protein